jgi:heptosyltransferase II
VPFERSLVVLKNYLGDTVMASPLVRSVAAESKATDILGSPVVEQLLRYPSFRARYYDPGNLANMAQLFRMVKQVKEGHYQAAFLVNRSFRSALLVRLAGIPVRIGHATEGRGGMLTSKIPYHPTKNEAECYLDLLRTVQVTPSVTRPELYVTDEERARGKELVNGATIGIQPGARNDDKQVPIGVWREVARKLADEGHKPAFLGGVEERSLLGELQVQGVDLVGKTTLRETIGALANLKLVLGADTGLMHLAAAAGTPTVTAFGPTSADKWGWFQEPHQVIKASGGNIKTVSASQLLEAAGTALCVSR